MSNIEEVLTKIKHPINFKKLLALSSDIQKYLTNSKIDLDSFDNLSNKFQNDCEFLSKFTDASYINNQIIYLNNFKIQIDIFLNFLVENQETILKIFEKKSERQEKFIDLFRYSLFFIEIYISIYIQSGIKEKIDNCRDSFFKILSDQIREQYFVNTTTSLEILVKTYDKTLEIYKQIKLLKDIFNMYKDYTKLNTKLIKNIINYRRIIAYSDCSDFFITMKQKIQDFLKIYEDKNFFINDIFEFYCLDIIRSGFCNFIDFDFIRRIILDDQNNINDNFKEIDLLFINNLNEIESLAKRFVDMMTHLNTQSKSLFLDNLLNQISQNKKDYNQKFYIQIFCSLSDFLDSKKTKEELILELDQYLYKGKKEEDLLKEEKMIQENVNFLFNLLSKTLTSEELEKGSHQDNIKIINANIFIKNTQKQGDEFDIKGFEFDNQYRVPDIIQHSFNISEKELQIVIDKLFELLLKEFDMKEFDNVKFQINNIKFSITKNILSKENDNGLIELGHVKNLFDITCFIDLEIKKEKFYQSYNQNNDKKRILILDFSEEVVSKELLEDIKISSF